MPDRDGGAASVDYFPEYYVVVREHTLTVLANKQKIQSKNSVYGAMRSGLEFFLLFPPPPLIPPFSWWHLCFIAANSHYRRPEKKKTEGKKQKVLVGKVNTLFLENSECCSQFLIPMIAALGKVFLFTDTPMG